MPGGRGHRCQVGGGVPNQWDRCDYISHHSGLGPGVLVWVGYEK